MARMSGEFTLVLLGAGILTAGSFLWPGDDVDAVANEHAGQQVASANATGSSGHRSHIPMLIYLHSSRSGLMSGTSRSAPVTRGGFGSIGRATSVVG
ncbi:MAG TPA: hypothetical protein VEL76_41165 [Gemmataceae bacterium]|nr:hypothetical protein [Gemmataceae bacterium]